VKVLLSYHYYAKTDLDREFASFAVRPSMVFGDSGAFSAWSQGASIDPAEYAKWVKRWYPSLLTWYANLDVIGSAEGTWRNQLILEKQHGLSPLPVFHVGEPWEFLDRYFDRGYPYVCLGGMVGQPEAPTLRWAAQCFKRARDRGVDVVFHGFGQTRRRVVESLPWFSMDSSSWSGGARYGQGVMWDDARARFLPAKVGSKELHRHGRLIRAHGVDPRNLSDRSRFHHSHVAQMSAVAWLRYEQWLRNRYRVPFPDRGDAAEGPHVCLASTGGDLSARLAHVPADAVPEGPNVYLALGVGETHKLGVDAKAGPNMFLAAAGGTDLSRDRLAGVQEAGGPNLYLANSEIINVRILAKGASTCE
jgi:hypothetical protein